MLQQLEKITCLSHNLRTPLNALSSALQVLQMYESGREIPIRQKYYKIADRNIKRMDRMINHFMDYFQMAKGETPFCPRVVDGVALTQALCRCAQECFGEELVDMNFTAEGKFPAWVDEALVEQAFWNLISNAVNATKERPCRLEIKIRCCEELFELSVRDFGKGIAEEDQKRIFDPLVQLDSFQSGIGLGLSIIMEIMKLHQGDVVLISAPGEGSTFILRFPFKKAVGTVQKNSSLSQYEVDAERLSRARIELADFLA